MPSGFCYISSLMRAWCLLLLLLGGASGRALAEQAGEAVTRHAVTPEGRHVAPATLHRSEGLQLDALAPATTDFSTTCTGCPAELPWQLPYSELSYYPAAMVPALPSAPAEPRLQQARRLLLALTPNAP
ncbi:hypothetical protein KBK19_06795 [Microvirga sp. STR05]|uniref:DUF2946 domain-containing protein n=1 Tax=Hymenobacter duratus TaxID=2771356 RepID=A0ABR8JD39_9BACT|nr:hypothetical protein [Hymenobacter duratus]MBD2714735.1 hypothetical protein [Hymenobacter duratus]MBR7949640.1 hypothetical protein [Microvirga sp. STR05]